MSSGCGEASRGGGLVGGEVVEHDAGEAAFEAAQGFRGRHALGSLLEVVGLAEAVKADLGDRDPVEVGQYARPCSPAWLPRVDGTRAYAQHVSGVLHPVGPEPARTYWLRRTLVLLVAAVLIAVLAMLSTVARGDGQVVAAPAGPTASVAAPRPTASVTTSAPTPSASPTARSAQPKSARASESPTPSTTATTAPRPQPATTRPCAPAQLRATLSGPAHRTLKQRATFQVGLRNATSAPCVLTVSQDNFELKIYSGTDRIWSSRDCRRSLDRISRRLAANRLVQWQMTWDGRRSRKDCERRPEIPRPGTYFTTAQLQGAEPVQVRMLLRS